MIQDTLDFNNDRDCVAVGKFALSWLQADMALPDSIDPFAMANEAKDISLYAFLMDILVCVGDDRYSADAQTLLAKMGQ